MWKSKYKSLRCSLTIRIFLITTMILLAACSVTYLFIAWATPISYYSIEADVVNEELDKLLSELCDTKLEDSGPIFDHFIEKTGAMVKVTDEDGEMVELPISKKRNDWEKEDIISEAVIVTDNAALSEDVYTEERVKEAAAEEVLDEIYINNAIEYSTATIEGTRTILENSSYPWYWYIPLFTGKVTYTNTNWSVFFTFAGDERGYHLTVTEDITPVNQSAEAMQKVLPYLLVVVLLLSMLGAVFYSRYITKPIVRLSSISQKMAELDFSWECGERRGDEIGVLGRNLDEMSRHLSSALFELQTANAALQEDIEKERELEQQRTAFFAAASHELKTPITIVKGQLSGMLAGVDIYQDRDKYLERSLAVTGRMEKLVQEMLMIARVEKAGSKIQQEKVNFSELVRVQLAQIEDLIMMKKQKLEVKIEPEIVVQGDTLLLGRAVSNLLGNAVQYSPDGERVTVSLRKEEKGPVLLVENSGIKIPEEALPHLFEAFYRVEGSRSRETGGSGLGLYLTKMILNRHGAECEVTNRENWVRVEVIFTFCAEGGEMMGIAAKRKM